ncbi:hypothetical protein ACFPN7_38255 [Amycolatopsis halotolerans]
MSAPTVSICALVFTVFSFWWLNARPGRYSSRWFSTTPVHCRSERHPDIR